MRYLLAALLLACASASAQNTNEQPLFGNSPQAQETTEANQRFIETATKAAGSKEAAANLETIRGWQLLKQGDVEAAIQSFNQANLLNPNNADVYWGLGVAMSRQDKFDLAPRLFERALILAPNNARLLADIGVAHARAAIRISQDPIEQAKRLQGALLWFDAAQKLEPGYAVIYANRALALYFLGNFTESWINVEKAEGIDRASVSAKLIANLSNKMSRPISSTAAPTSNTANVQTEAVAAPIEAQQETLAAPAVTPKIVMPKIPYGIPDQPAPAPQADVQKMAASAAQPTAEAQTEAPPSPPAKAVSTQNRRLKLVSDQPARPTSSDKRSCLDLPTNEAVITCVDTRK